MTETPTHTPLPWEAQVLETENDPGVYIVGSNLGGLVCAALPWPTEIESGDYSRVEANAAFIVQAANSHHRLVEALEWYGDTFCELGKSHECCGRLTDDECSGCKARSLLATLKEAGR